MASFIQPSFPREHMGVARVESAVGAVGAMRRGFDSTRGLSAMLLAAMVSSLVVVADQLIETWADGHLMVAWVALWLVGFAALAIFAGAARKLAVTFVGAMDAWSARVARARADERLWVIARTDPRVMADLTAAMSRNVR
ncbi:hypothetical protein [Rhodoferax sp.]|uniref:hypothetical protein n=1 Tax=Rhodoferax sp. TaxID=50421 RepID=UPI0027279D28|nr:hypothetical protein [Rhodoferax sp.]MDO9197809.1 hypothetical protein [Rhodoferax sp.]